MTLPSLRDQRPWTRELIIFGLFVLLTLVMTWPWVTHLRDATTDPGDPYLNSWILWWDYHQTFHNPLHLFDGNIYFPYRYTLAFSEHNYGIALLCFPLFAAGLRPLTVNGIATLLAFAFSGYGMFRLARTITGCTGPALLAGLVFAFAPYRFEQIFHLNYLFAGWIPILVEALLRFTRTRSRKAAVWLGVAFLMNGLTCVHWFVLTLIPLALSVAFLLVHYRAWRDLAYWRRAIPAVGAAGLALLPFFLPYKRAGELYGFARSAGDALIYSATYSDWLVGSFLNKIWSSLHEGARKGERALFPGVVPAAIAAFAFVGSLLHGWRARSADVLKSPHRRTRVILDASLIVLAILTLKVAGTGFLKIRIAGFYLLKLYSVIPLAVLAAIVLAIRLLISRVQIGPPRNVPNHVPIRQPGFWQRLPEGFTLALIWLVTGFFGSLGMNFFFHRLLFNYIPLFHSIRVPARWATPAYLGLALLVAIGAKHAGDLLRTYWPKFRPALAYGALALCMLFEQRAFPLELIHGAVDPDALTLRLKQTPMTGGIVELPNRYGSRANYEYVLRAADHAQPLITAFSGFEPPLSKEIENASNASPIADSFLDLLENIPCSYLVVHNDFLGPARRAVIEQFLRKAITSGRVRFIRSYEGADLYAIVKNEPNAVSEGPLPFPQPPTSSSLLNRSSNISEIGDARSFVQMLYTDFFGRQPEPEGLEYWTRQLEDCGKASSCAEQRVAIADAFFNSPEVQTTDFFTVRLFKATLGRAPRFEEFESIRTKLMKAGATREDNQNSVIESWLQSQEMLRLYSSHLAPDQFVDALLRTVKETSPTTLDDERQQLVERLNQTRDRAAVVKRIVNDSKLIRAEEDRAFVLLQYFVFLKRDPDQKGYEYWLGVLRDTGDRRRIVAAFITATHGDTTQ